jgi:hypothetical protein
MKISREHFFLLFTKLKIKFNSGEKIGGKCAYGFDKNIQLMSSEIKSIGVFAKEIKYTDYEEKIKELNDAYKDVKCVTDEEKEKVEKEIEEKIKPLKEEHKAAIEQFNKFIKEEVEIEFYKIKMSDFNEYLNQEIDTGNNFMFWKPLLIE